MDVFYLLLVAGLSALSLGLIALCQSLLGAEK